MHGQVSSILLYMFLLLLQSLTQHSLLAVIQITETLFNKRLPPSFLLSTLRLLTKPLAKLYLLQPAAQTKLLTLQTMSKVSYEVYEVF